MHSNIAKGSFFLFLVLASAISFSQPAPLSSANSAALSATNITFKIIDVPGATATVADGINNSGTIVGFFADSAGTFHGYLADKDGNFVKAIDFPGAAQTQPFGINEKGEIVGSYVDDGGVFHGFLLHDGNFATLDFPDAAATFPDDINDQGVIAGAYQDALFAFHGFVLDKDGFRTVDDPAQGSLPSTQLFSINSKGDILGDFAADEFGIFHGAFLLTHGTFIPFTVPGATQGIFAIGLNNNNDVAGSFFGDDFVQHGFIADKGNIIHFDFPGAIATAPFQINASRHTVGVYADRAVNTHSFLVTFDDPGADTGAAAEPANAALPTADTNGQAVICGAQQTIHSGGNLSRAQNLICHY